jgi:hypothetical protein
LGLFNGCLRIFLFTLRCLNRLFFFLYVLVKARDLAVPARPATFGLAIGARVTSRCAHVLEDAQAPFGVGSCSLGGPEIRPSSAHIRLRSPQSEMYVTLPVDRGVPFRLGTLGSLDCNGVESFSLLHLGIGRRHTADGINDGLRLSGTSVTVGRGGVEQPKLVCDVFYRGTR